ncbi:MAG: hypothetical protein NTW98_00485 [Candidatus Nomurabacteria bacterium]|nr:hypothetical protein [Candidatus Nomurabacteria bacterium]
MELDNDELAKKYLLIIKKIIQKESLNPILKGDEDKEWSSFEVWNDEFSLMNWEFVGFFELLEYKNILTIISSTFIQDSDHGEEMGYTIGSKEAGVFYKRVDVEKAIQYKNELENSLSYLGRSESNNLSKLEDKENLWITKNNDGNYYFDGNKIDISQDADYAKIFDAILSIKPGGGDIEYNEIKKNCKTKKLNTTNHSVQKALTGKDSSFFRFTKGIKQYPKFGIPLFKASSAGKYITFNNKKNKN